MSEVFKLGISTNNNQPINEVSSIEVLANQGVVGDRHFKEFNDPYNQLSLIESENIDYYNVKFGLNIPYIDFRRNIITKGIQLNNLVGKKILVGNVKLEVIDFKKDQVDTRLKHLYLNDKGIKLFEEIFNVQKKRIYKALLNSSSKEVINFNNVLNKIINEKI